MGKKYEENVLKVNLKLAISRFKLQKQKRDNNIKNQKREIAELLRSGKEESARIKVEGIIREDFIIEAYDILELFCELLLTRLGVIQISKECPPDLRESICSLIYAAPRVEVKEMPLIREQLIYKFGKEFAMDAMSNKDNCVNARITHKLSIQTPENFLVFQYLNEIAKSYNLDWCAPEVEHHHHHIENSGPTVVPGGIPAFPEPPRSNMGTIAPSLFPAVPTPNGQATFPSVPTPSTATFPDVPVPSFGNFPSQPSFPTVPTPTNMSGFPSVPSGPSFTTTTTTTNFPTFPTPPNNTTTTTTTVVNFPSIPSGPNFGGTPSGNTEFPNFPSVPTLQSNTNIPSGPADFPSKGDTLRFPTPPSGGNNNDTLKFPAPPKNDTTTTAPDSSKNTLNFPSTPTNNSNGASNADSNVPDFDELTARFEKLKKKNM